MLKTLLLFMFVWIVQNQFPKILWTYWQGNQNQTVIKLFADNHKRMLENSGWDVILLDEKSIKKYIDKIPYYKGDFYIYDYVELSHKADYARCLILSYYGGVYIDMSSILIQNFSWLQFSNLRNNPHILNKYGNQPDILLFSTPGIGPNKLYYHEQTNQTFDIFPGYQLWFMAAVPNCTLIIQYIPILREGFRYKTVKQQEEHLYLDRIIREQKIQLGEKITHSSYLSSLQLLQVLIQRKQKQLDKKRQQNNSSVILVSWYYKIWHIPSQYGPFSVFLSPAKINQTYLLTKYPTQILTSITNRTTIRYFYKLTLQCRKILIQYFNASDVYKCPKKYQIFTHSVVHQYLIKNTQFDGQINTTQLIQNELQFDYCECNNNPNPNTQNNKKQIQIIVFVQSIILMVFICISIFLYTKILHLKKWNIRQNQNILQVTTQKIKIDNT